MWIVHETLTDETFVFNTEEEAVECFKKWKVESVEHAANEGHIYPEERIYIAEVKKYAEWQEDEDYPIYETDDYGDETEKESGEFYYTLNDVERRCEK